MRTPFAFRRIFSRPVEDAVEVTPPPLLLPVNWRQKRRPGRLANVRPRIFRIPSEEPAVTESLRPKVLTVYFSRRAVDQRPVYSPQFFGPVGGDEPGPDALIPKILRPMVAKPRRITKKLPLILPLRGREQPPAEERVPGLVRPKPLPELAPRKKPIILPLRGREDPPPDERPPSPLVGIRRKIDRRKREKKPLILPLRSREEPAPELTRPPQKLLRLKRHPERKKLFARWFGPAKSEITELERPVPIVTKKHVFNYASSWLGVATVSDPEENTIVGERHRLNWDIERRAFIESYPTTGVRQTLNLVQAASNPNPRWDFAFILPQNCIRPLSINDDGHQASSTAWDIETDPITKWRLLFTNSNEVYLTFVADTDDVTHMSPLALKTLGLQLALSEVGFYNKDAAFIRDLEGRLLRAHEEMRSIDGRIGTPPQRMTNPIIDARRQGFHRRGWW